MGTGMAEGRSWGLRTGDGIILADQDYISKGRRTGFGRKKKIHKRGGGSIGATLVQGGGDNEWGERDSLRKGQRSSVFRGICPIKRT